MQVAAPPSTSRATVIKSVIAVVIVTLIVVAAYYLGRPIYWRIASEEPLFGTPSCSYYSTPMNCFEL